MTQPAVGYVLALTGALFNGSFAAVQKVSRVAKVDPHPMLINGYVCFGLVVSCFLVIPFFGLLEAEVKVNPLGILSGCLFVGAVCCSFLAIPRLGLAMANSVWCGCALTTSFLWGVFGPAPIGSSPKSWPGSIGALLCLLTGILGIVFHSQIASRLPCCSTFRDTDDDIGNSVQAQSSDDEEDIMRHSNPTSATNLLTGKEPMSKKLSGLCFALVCGLFGGSVNVPSTLTKVYGTPLNGIETVPSFGIGALIANLMIMIVMFGFVDRPALQRTGFACKGLLLPGFVSGTMWNIGNVCSIYAGNYGISFAVAQPLQQTALFFAGLLGIFVFKEIRGFANIACFFASVTVLLTGAMLLGIYGPAP